MSKTHVQEINWTRIMWSYRILQVALNMINRDAYDVLNNIGESRVELVSPVQENKVVDDIMEVEHINVNIP